MSFRYLNGPITREQDEFVASLPDRRAYCWLIFWIPGHPLHDEPCI